jgi:hypothetical protein
MSLKEDLLNVTLDLDDVLKKYDLNLKYILEDLNYDDYFMLLNDKDSTFDKCSHIFKDNNKFVVQKTVNKKSCYFGSYKSLVHAVEVRNRLKEVDWDVTKLHDIQKDVLGYVKHVPRVYYTLWDSSRVQYFRSDNPMRYKSFKLKFNNSYVPIGCFLDFVSVEIIRGLVDEFIS